MMLSQAQLRPQGDLLVLQERREEHRAGFARTQHFAADRSVFDRRRHQRIPQGIVPVNRDSQGLVQL